MGQDLGPDGATVERGLGTVSALSPPASAQQAMHVMPGGLGLRATPARTPRAACGAALVKEVFFSLRSFLSALSRLLCRALLRCSISSRQSCYLLFFVCVHVGE